MKSCVNIGDEEVRRHIHELFGKEKSVFCSCGFIRPSNGIPFEIVEPVEFWTDKDGILKKIIPKGIYRIVDSHVSTIQESHELRIESFVDGKWVYINESAICSLGWIFGGWAGGYMIDWRGIKPVKIP